MGRSMMVWFAVCLVLAASVYGVGGIVFRGVVQAEIVSVVPGPDGVTMTAEGTGYATQLGKYTRVETIVLDPATGSVTGTVEFSGASGEVLNADISGQFTSASTAEGTYQFTGGTGRFENAAGSADFDVSLTDASHFIGSFAGSVDR
jgi:hypothetical protein